MPDDRRAESDVILDVDFADGLLYLAVENIGDLPAHGVRVRIEPPLSGHGGRTPIDGLALFSRLELLAPRKRIRVFLDRAALYFARDEPTALTATTTWRTDAGERLERVVRHDLGIYRDLAYVHTEVPERADEA